MEIVINYNEGLENSVYQARIVKASKINWYY